MTKNAISSDLVGLPWQHQMYDGNFKHISLYIGMFSFSYEQNIKRIKIWDISQNLRPNVGLIDPSPLLLFHLLRLFGHEILSRYLAFYFVL